MTSGFFAARRALAPAGVAAEGPPLELQRDASADAPRLVDAECHEGRTIRVRPVGADDGRRVAAFLDGRQESRLVAHAGLVPVVWGEVGAVIRVRRDRRLHTWEGGLRREAALYAPLRALPLEWPARLAAVGRVRDTWDESAPGHPFAWTDRAYHAVQDDREALERELARRWIAAPEGVLYVDGGIGRDDAIAQSRDVLGVVKSHRSLYLPAAALPLLAALRPGERTTAVRITSPRRTPVASWYCRRYEARGGDPFDGLVRLETALGADEPEAAFTAHADACTRLVLAERAPLAAPDPRWPVMAYGIRDCEQVLRAVMG